MKTAHDPIVDPEVQDSIQHIVNNINCADLSLEQWDLQAYLDQFDHWIKSSSYNVLRGLDSFPVRAYSCGSLESIVSFVHRHATKRRIRFSRAEFVASKIAANHCQCNWCFLEDDVIMPGDAVIISAPFSGNGGYYPNFNNLIDSCNINNVPVLLDISYYGISHGIIIDVDQPCITDVVCSLSKPMNVQFRLGIRFCKTDHDDLVQVNSNLKLFNRLSATVGIELMKNYTHDWFVRKYLPKHKNVCKQHNLEPTNTFTLAIGSSPEFMRNGFCRVCITEELLND
jgi:hypothetical protein